MINIVIGIIFIVGGLSGKFVLIGTDSSTAITVVGVGLLIYGATQMFGGEKTGPEAALAELEQEESVSDENGDV